MTRSPIELSWTAKKDIRGVKVEQNLFPSLEYLPEQEVEEQGVEVDTVADRSRKQHQLAPQLGVVRVPDKQYIFYELGTDWSQITKIPTKPLSNHCKNKASC